MTTESLIEAARDARKRAYCPYSGYAVGAAIESESGEVFTGCNVENVSYGATLCAERVALGAMVAAGNRRFVRIALATDDGGTPCGICLQVLAEFGKDVEVLVADSKGNMTTYRLRELLPAAFSSSEVIRTERAGD